MADIALLAARFGARLRAEGLPVGPERSARFAAAVSLVRPETTTALYWCGLATLVGDPGEIAVYDSVFALVFGGLDDPAELRGDPNAPPFRAGAEPFPPAAAPVPRPAQIASLAGAQTDDTPDGEPEPDAPHPALASAAERLGGRDFAMLSGDE
jgi:uncharacterized protein with von Willebrand factor type A (vWA) domain